MVDEMPHAIFFDSPLRSYYEFINTFNIAVIDVIVYTSNVIRFKQTQYIPFLEGYNILGEVM